MHSLGYRELCCFQEKCQCGESSLLSNLCTMGAATWLTGCGRDPRPYRVDRYMRVYTSAPVCVHTCVCMCLHSCACVRVHTFVHGWEAPPLPTAALRPHCMLPVPAHPLPPGARRAPAPADSYMSQSVGFLISDLELGLTLPLPL